MAAKKHDFSPPKHYVLDTNVLLHDPQSMFQFENNVVHVPAGPPRSVPKDELLPHMDAFAQVLEERWSAAPPDLVHAHFWMSGLASVEAVRGLAVPAPQTFQDVGY